MGDEIQVSTTHMNANPYRVKSEREKCPCLKIYKVVNTKTGPKVVNMLVNKKMTTVRDPGETDP